MSLRTQVIRLAHADANCRPYLLPIIREASQPKGELTVSGPFHMYVPTKLAGLRTQLQVSLEIVSSMYKNAGLSLGSGPIVVSLGGVTESFYNGTQNYIVMAPHALNKPRDAALIHEMAHWYHYNRIRGGSSNPKIIAKYQWALSSLRPSKPSVLKGMTYEKVGWDNPYTKNTQYTRIYKVVSVTKSKSVVEIQNPSEFDKKRSPLDLREEMPTSYLEAKLNPGKAPLDASGAVHRVEDDTWMPSAYAKTNFKEWFAEIVTHYLLNPSGTNPDVKDWLLGLAP